ncbi:class I SAM-dependent methyltransferase [Deinococcus pimensis]|uniref:class I SAM-dependent methyltransferase n=1 Tax=Deinococcus pimensis TaxID=309888 RepID=UPI0004BB9923|nr:class I SAM-dependent methyltransferase [Deinococcus pimensis]
MTTSTDLMDRLTHLIDRQTQLNVDAVYYHDRAAPRAYLLAEDTARTLFEFRRDIEPILNPNRISDLHLQRRLLDHFARRYRHSIYDALQFVTFDAAHDRLVERVYLTFCHGLWSVLQCARTEQDLAARLQLHAVKHHRQLRLVTRSLFEQHASVVNVQALKAVTCAQYSPELQLEVLGLDEATVNGPLLDVGCGEDGRLVQYLRTRHVHAVGVDRLVTPHPALFELDWHDLPAEQERWNTITSHLAFSHHFLYHHQRASHETVRFARTFQRLLSNLTVGGTFAYAPSLPFIEQLLPDHTYLVTRQDIPAPAPPQGQTTAPLLQRTQIRKLRSSSQT